MRVGTRRRGQTDIRGLVTAGRAVRLERFCWSNGSSVASRVNPVAAHSRFADRSSRGRLLVVLVRLLWGLGWTKPSMFTATTRRAEEGHSSIRAIPDGAWEESTWSTRSAASMNDVDAEEHRQTIGRAGTALPGVHRQAGRFLVIVFVRPRPCPVSRPSRPGTSTSRRARGRSRRWRPRVSSSGR